MPRRIVPGIGPVDFPDNMADDEIDAIVQQKSPAKPPMQQPPQGMLQRAAQSAPVQGVLGAGDALQNQMANLANIIPGVHAPMAQSGQGTAYNVGRGVGNVGGFALAGGPAGATLKGAEAIPLLGKLAQALAGGGGAGITRRALGAGTYGAVESPENRVLGAGEGAVLSAALEGFPALIGKVADNLNPGQHVKKILDVLGGGAKSLEENAKNLAARIKNSYEGVKKQASTLYFDPVKQAVGEKNIYRGPLSEYKKASEEISSHYPKEIKELHEKYLEDPTFNNAHELQSALGSEVGYYQRLDRMGTLAPEQRHVLNGIQEARNSVKSNISNFLAAKGEGVKSLYDKGIQFYKEHVVPYTSDRDLARIAKGEIKNPKSSQIVSIFESPEEQMSQVAQHLGKEGRNKIMYAHVGNKKSPEQMYNALSNLEKPALGSYASDELHMMKNVLGHHIKKKDLTQRGLGAITGYLLGGPFGMGAELMGAGLGGVLGPSISKAIPGGAKSLVESISRHLSKAGRVARNVAVPSMAPMELELNDYAGVEK